MWKRLAATFHPTPQAQSFEVSLRRPTMSRQCAPSPPSTSTCCPTATPSSALGVCRPTAFRLTTPGCRQRRRSSRQVELIALQMCVSLERHRTASALSGLRRALTDPTSFREPSYDGYVVLTVKLSTQRNETDTKQFQYSFETVLKLFYILF